MYSSYYDVLIKKYEDKIRLVCTDTDSFGTQNETEHVFDDFNSIKQHMFCSGYEKEHRCSDPANKKVLKKFKDEVDGKMITHFIGLKPKSYAFKIYKQDKEETKAKGIVAQKRWNTINATQFHSMT